jgi:hypothetical protein
VLPACGRSSGTTPAWTAVIRLGSPRWPPRRCIRKSTSSSETPSSAHTTLPWREGEARQLHGRAGKGAGLWSCGFGHRCQAAQLRRCSPLPPCQGETFPPRRGCTSSAPSDAEFQLADSPLSLPCSKFTPLFPFY